MTAEISKEDESNLRAHFQLQKTLKLLHYMTTGAYGNEIMARSLRGFQLIQVGARSLQLIQVDASFLLCNFIVSAYASIISLLVSVREGSIPRRPREATRAMGAIMSRLVDSNQDMCAQISVRVCVRT
ncbi:hypothetical protein F3Y22_tig00111772pilonHSYRG00144 [Hibiscus syriacus]|uniref:Uncharacterized protein n=1 Tax=Hibiscus syriacus TaxID=106335 RepID=A0A6A2YH35_HIBSY|nr:hypothetical protein F3Y22_tig00111772pilonHSYRG00144 [Hibiscus syriacus]